jgi:hypothetical protein
LLKQIDSVTIRSFPAADSANADLPVDVQQSNAMAI